MTFDTTLIAALSLTAGIAAIACGSVRGGAFVLQPHSVAEAADTVARTFRSLAGVFLVLSLLLALIAGAGLWLERGGFGGSTDRAYPSAWGALWVYALSLVTEWRTMGLAGAGRRILIGVFLGGTGVLALGVGFEIWLKLVSLPLPDCEEGGAVIEATGIEAAAALGLSLAVIAGPALRLLPLSAMPLSAMAASVAIATWMQPALPALAWLPTEAGGGAPLALALLAALWLLLRSCGRHGRATVLGSAAYFVVGAGGSVALGAL